MALFERQFCLPSAGREQRRNEVAGAHGDDDVVWIERNSRRIATQGHNPNLRTSHTRLLDDPPIRPGRMLL
jgi:hypothetical protein